MGIAVDNLVDGLSRAGVRVARIGRPEAVRQDLMPFMVESIAGIEPGSNMSKDQQYQAINGVLRRAEVICGTNAVSERVFLKECFRAVFEHLCLKCNIVCTRRLQSSHRSNSTTTNYFPVRLLRKGERRKGSIGQYPQCRWRLLIARKVKNDLMALRK